MKNVKVAAATLNQTPRAWRSNAENILRAIEIAKKSGVKILCLPELCITGYGMEDDFFCADVPKRAMAILQEMIAPKTENITVCVGLPVVYRNALYNAVATVCDGKILGFSCKKHLAGDGIHYEPRHFKAWPQGTVQWIDNENHFPIGDLIFDIGGIHIGYEICEDAWVADRPGATLSRKGVDIILNPSASHFAFGKIETRKNFVIEGSRAFGVTYLYANLVGNESGRAIFDGGAMIATGGQLVAMGKRFTYQDVLVTSAVVDVDNTRTSQIRTASFKPNLHDDEDVVSADFYYPEIRETNLPIELPQWEKENVKHEECTKAIGLALMDYMRKSHTHGFAISLSGGSDSALVTYLCVEGMRNACMELGMEEFNKKYCPHLPLTNDFTFYTRKLITTAYQSTAQSGEVTRTAAAKIAEALGVTHHDISVEAIVSYYKALGTIFNGGKEMTFEVNAIPLQNLQARVRSPSIWIIANLENKLLLTTSNMSEAALGYATMDGDTSGCVAPVAGLPKVYIREYLSWVEKSGHLPAMAYVNQQQPTAELMPKEYEQTDEKDLMPYWLLHRIETMVVKNRYVPVEIYKAIRAEFRDYPNNRLIDDIKKFFRLFSRNQWKRERCALSFHVDDHNLDPRTWCRAPILTGGYELEMSELDLYYDKT